MKTEQESTEQNVLNWMKWLSQRSGGWNQPWGKMMESPMPWWDFLH